MKIILADANEEFCEILLSHLERMMPGVLVKIANDGLTLRKIVRAEEPDLVVANVSLPLLDGISVMQELRASREAHQPELFVLSTCSSSTLQRQIGQLHPAYVSMMPCSMLRLAEQIVFCCREMSRPYAFSNDDADRMLTHILRELGLSVQSKGFLYAKVCIRMVLEHEEMPALTKELYPAAARKCGTTVANVERAIRSSIVSAWQREGFLLQSRLFFARPSNGEFFGVTAQLIRDLQSENQESSR